MKSLFLAFIFVFSACESESVEADITSFDASANSSPAAQKGDQTIAQIVVASTQADEPQFTLLLAALNYTGLTETFTGGDNYTVFAPTDDAFLALLGGDANNLFTLSPEDVANILLYHVTDGRRFSNSVLGKKNPKQIEMLNDAMIYVNSDGEIDTNDDDLDLNATIVAPNIAASNGVIHVIDAVLVPASE